MLFRRVDGVLVVSLPSRRVARARSRVVPSMEGVAVCWRRASLCRVQAAPYGQLCSQLVLRVLIEAYAAYAANAVELKAR